MIYTVTLNPALDYILRLPRLSSEDVNRADSAQLLCGGKGINVSMVLSGLEVPTRALGFVAGFTGRALEQMLQAQGIQTDFVPLAAGNTRINVKIFADRQTDINAPGAQPAEAEVEALFHKLEGLMPGDFLVLAGAVPSQMPGSIYEQICAKLQNKGVHIVVDTTGDALLAVLDYHPFLIKPNHHELGEIFGEDIRPDDDEKIRFFAAKLQEKGARNVLVSRGKYGATLLAEDGSTHSVGVVPGKPVNNVGCGDSMVAGFLAGYADSGDYKTALQWASAAGNASAFCEITFPSLATVYPACGKLTCFGIEIALMAFGICHPAGCHNTLAFCKIVGIFAIDLHPALYLYSGLCVKVVLVSAQGQPAFLLAPITFYVVCFSIDSFKACSGSLYLFCRSRKDCASHDQQHSKHQTLQPIFLSETLHNFPHFLF